MLDVTARPCSTQGCSWIGERPCPDHRRPSSWALGYDGDWQRDRAQQLAVQAWCEDHLARGEHVPATEVDHVLARAAGGLSAPGNLRSLCKACHSRKTARTDRPSQQPAGWRQRLAAPARGGGW